MPEENVEVPPSADNGNVPVDAPSVEPTPAPAAPEPVQPTVPELYDLPDGRKVDGVTLSKEWKENFLPDYTRKSQELAKVKPEPTINQTPAKPYADPNWQPQTYEELLKIAEDKVLTTLEQREQEKFEQRQALENAVVTQLAELKTLDANLNENALFAHATKYGFKDLKIAHQNMKDMSELAKKVQTTTAANIAKRNDPVSVSPGATGAKSNPSQFGNAIDYLRSIK